MSSAAANPTIRPETTADQGSIRAVNEAAFGRVDEANLVDNLRRESAVLLSLVAEVGGQVVGHILFTRMWIDHTGGSTAAVALAPMAILPSLQRQGVGGQLIRAGLDSLRAHGERIVIVLGHPDYYPRFGFSAEKARCLASPFPPQAYMALELRGGALTDVRGTVRYAAAFGL